MKAPYPYPVAVFFHTGNKKYMQNLSETSSRLEALEVKVAYQEDTIEQLNAVVIQQRDLLDAHELKLKLLTEKFRELQQSDGNSFDVHEKPPHY